VDWEALRIIKARIPLLKRRAINKPEVDKTLP